MILGKNWRHARCLPSASQPEFSLRPGTREIQLKCYIARMRRGWLQTSIGVNVVAVGLVAIVFSLVLFTVQDCWILFRGEPFVLHGLNGIWYLLWAAIAALFSAITVFIWPPGLHRQVYAPRHRAEWLAKITEAGVRRRAELYYQQLDALRPLHQQARKELLAEGRKHSATKWLRQIPGIGPLRAAQLVALPQTPHRFRSKRQLWTYSGLALETHDSAQYRYAQGQLQRSKKPQQLRGLNANHNHDLKNIFKGAAMRASTCHGPLRNFYEALLAKGMRPTMARLTLARKIAAITLILWKKGVRFDAQYLKLAA